MKVVQEKLPPRILHPYYVFMEWLGLFRTESCAVCKNFRPFMATAGFCTKATGCLCRDMDRFPKDCWHKKCKHFHVTDMSVDDLLCACDVLKMECDACDEDFCFALCPLAEDGE